MSGICNLLTHLKYTVLSQQDAICITFSNCKLQPTLHRENKKSNKKKKQQQQRYEASVISYFHTLHLNMYFLLQEKHSIPIIFPQFSTGTLDVNLVPYTLICLNRDFKLSVVFCMKPLPFPHQVIILFFQLQMHSIFSQIHMLVAVWLVQRCKHQR